ncbi:hypothetical protein [Nisaea denitrificans]|uniref:hypothetical protein n=1 Tax=Nisaea denitrificans TaxID=390877 RepID=UPI000491A2B2|nr:hypothetical protein [Nisaea denitrificans]
MQYGDFLTLVQLSVGLHLGTALLQLYGDIGMQPLIRILDRIKILLQDDKVIISNTEQYSDEFDSLDAKFEIFKISLFNEYKKYVAINFLVAAGLFITLIVLTYLSHYEVSVAGHQCMVVVIALGVLPAPLSLLVLWTEANRKLKPILNEADDLERRIITKAS